MDGKSADFVSDNFDKLSEKFRLFEVENARLRTENEALNVRIEGQGKTIRDPKGKSVEQEEPVETLKELVDDVMEKIRDFEVATAHWPGNQEGKTAFPQEEGVALTFENNIGDEMTLPLRTVIKRRDATIVQLKKEVEIATRKGVSLEKENGELSQRRLSDEKEIEYLHELLGKTATELQNSKTMSCNQCAAVVAFNNTTQKTNTELRVQLGERDSNIYQMKHNTAILQRELGTMKLQLSTLMGAKRALCTALAKKDTAITKLQERIGALDQTLNDHRNWIMERDDKINELEKMLHDGKAEIDHLKGQLECIHSGVDDGLIIVQERAGKIAKLEARLRERVLDVEKLNADVRVTYDAWTKARSSPKERDAKIEEFAVDLRDDIDVTKAKEALSRRCITSDEGNLSLALIELRIEDLRDQVDALYERLEGNVHGETEGVLQKLAQVEKKIEGLQLELELSQGGVDGLRKVVEESDQKIEELEANLKEAIADTDEAKTEVCNLEEELALRGIYLDNTKISLGQRDVRILTLECEAKVLENSLKQARKEIGNLKNDSEEKEACHETRRRLLVERDYEIVKLQRDLEDTQNYVEAEKVVTDKLEAEVLKHLIALEKEQDLVATRDSHIEVLEEQIERLEEELHDERTDLMDARAEVSKLDGKLYLLQKTVDDTNKILKHRKDKIQEYDQSCGNLLAKTRDQESDISGLKAGLISTRQMAADEARDSRAQWDAHVKELGEKIQDLEGTVENGKSVNRVLLRKFQRRDRNLTDAQKSLAEKDKHIKSLEGPQDKLQLKESEIEDLKVEVDELKDAQSGVAMDEYDFVEESDFDDDSEIGPVDGTATA